MGHVRGFEYFGCVPRLIVPDNLKSAVTKACWYDPDINHDWLQCKVGFDYHIEVEKHYYSVPYQYYGKKVDIRMTERTIEVFYRSERICIHQRDNRKYRYTTLSEHMPPSHRKVTQWTPARLINWGHTIGLHTGNLIERIILSKSHPEQGFRPARGIIRLGEILNALLKNGKDRTVGIPDESRTVNNTENIRVKTYYETV